MICQVLIYNIGVSEKLLIKDTNFLNFSILLEESHFITKPTRQFDECLDISVKSVKKPLIEKKPIKKKRCCFIF